MNIRIITLATMLLGIPCGYFLTASNGPDGTKSTEASSNAPAVAPQFQQGNFKIKEWSELSKQLGLPREQKWSASFGLALKQIAIFISIPLASLTQLALFRAHPDVESLKIGMAVGFLSYCACLILGDYMINRENELEAHTQALLKVMKNWDKISPHIPKQVRPLFDYLHAIYLKDVTLKLSDNLVEGMYEEIEGLIEAAARDDLNAMTQVINDRKQKSLTEGSLR